MNFTQKPVMIPFCHIPLFPSDLNDLINKNYRTEISVAKLSEFSECLFIMAEGDISEKDLAELKIDEEEEEKSNYKAPAKKTVDEINQLDAEDESLRKYKEVNIVFTFISS